MSYQKMGVSLGNQFAGRWNENLNQIWQNIKGTRDAGLDHIDDKVLAATLVRNPEVVAALTDSSGTAYRTLYRRLVAMDYIRDQIDQVIGGLDTAPIDAGCFKDPQLTSAEQAAIQAQIAAMSLSGRNLVQGTAFTDLSQWAAGNSGHYVIDTTNLCNGNNSLKISTTASTYDGVSNPQTFALQPNAVYTMSFWDYISASTDIPSGKSFRVYVVECDSSGAILNYHIYGINSSNITPGTWGKYTLQFTTAGTANHGQFRADFSNVAGTAQIWLSEIKVETGSTATPWSPAPEDILMDRLGRLACLPIRGGGW